MPRRTSTQRLLRDLATVGQDLDAVYGPPATTPDPERPVNAARAAAGLPELTPAQSIEIAAHLLGPEHCGRFVEVQRPRQPITRGGQQHPGEYRTPGPLAGRLVGYQSGVASQGPNTGTPVRSLELFIQQGPHMTTATVSWADPVRISTTA